MQLVDKREITVDTKCKDLERLFKEKLGTSACWLGTIINV